jgi:hypothetical protein
MAEVPSPMRSKGPRGLRPPGAFLSLSADGRDRFQVSGLSALAIPPISSFALRSWTLGLLPSNAAGWRLLGITQKSYA